MGKNNFRIFIAIAVSACFIKNAQAEAIPVMQNLIGIEAAKISNVTVTVITGKQKTESGVIMHFNPDIGRGYEETLYDGGGTDCSLTITFCRDNRMNDCSKDFLLDAADDDLEEGSTGVFNVSAPDHLTGEYKYFRLALEDSKCGSSPQWHLQGIKVKMDGYTYFNPCVNKRFAPGDSLDFGPFDTAVCAIIRTGDEDHSGTDNNVGLVLKDNGTAYELSKTSLYLFAPFFIGSADNGIMMVLEWAPLGGYNDFEKADLTSYGAYFFDSDPLAEQPEFFIKKATDGKKGGWLLEEYEVFVFQPGGGTVFYKTEKPNAWIEDESGLTYPRNGWIKLDEAGQEVIKDSIGGYL